MGVLDEFKKFLLRGNLADLAVGFTVGAAFTTVAKSLVSDVVMPVVGLAVGRADFKDLFLLLHPGEGTPPYPTIEQAQAAGAVTLNYGVFVNNVLALLVVGVAMFALVRAVNRLQDRLADDDGATDEAPAEPDDKKCRYCRTTIPFRAIRCPACTSELGAPAAPAPAPPPATA